MTLQLLLLQDAPGAPAAKFDGETYEPRLDAQRLSSQLHEVERILQDGGWHTIPQIALQLRKRSHPCTEAGVSARIRDLRKERFGGYRVDRRRADKNGLFEYRIATEAA